MKLSFNTLLLASSLFASSLAYGQEKEPIAKASITASTTQASTPLMYKMNNLQMVNLENIGLSALKYEFTDNKNTEQKLYVMMPSEDKLKEMKTTYNAILAPVPSVNFEGKGMYGRSEYASFVIAKEKRSSLTPELLNDSDALKKFLETKGNVTEINRNIRGPDVEKLYQDNKDSGQKPSASKDGAAFYALIGG